MLAVFMSGLVAAACASRPVAAQVGEQVLIRNGFVVPPGKLLLVDDMSVDCVIASEVLDEQEFPKVGVEATAYLRIVYPVGQEHHATAVWCPAAIPSKLRPWWSRLAVPPEKSNERLCLNMAVRSGI
jgi:hypothetical protein